MNGLFVTGTDTNVGKTWVGSQLLKALYNRGIKVNVRKPVESGWPLLSDEIKNTDAWLLADSVGKTDQLSLICPNHFTAALSPDRAAALEGVKLELQQLQKDCLTDLNEDAFLYVEGAGGLYSPICDDGLNADLASALKLPVLLVVENRLGCINQTLLNIEAMKRRGLKLVGIALNSTKPDESNQSGMDNFSDISKRVDCDVVMFGYKNSPTESLTTLANLVLK